MGPREKFASRSLLTTNGSGQRTGGFFMQKNKVLFISATHGDEGFSIEVLDELERKYPKGKYGFERIIGNLKALAKNIRFTQSDLNRSAPGNIKSKIYEKKRAAEIMKKAKKYKFVIDLHGANSKCGVVIIISYPSLENIILSGLFSIERVVIWYTCDCLKNGPITQFCQPPGLEIECGLKTDLKVQKELKMVLEEFLSKYKTFTIDEIMKNLAQKEFYVIYEKLKGDGKNMQDFKEVKKGKEVFYPFMSNQYPGIACYKMEKIKFEELFLSKIK